MSQETALTVRSHNYHMVIGDKQHSANHAQRLSLFVRWLDDNGQSWHSPDLGQYRDYLLHEYEGKRGKLSNTSIAAYISTARGRLKEIADSNAMRQFIMGSCQQDAPPERKHAIVQEAVIRLQNALNPKHSKVSITKKQDIADSEHVRLSRAESNRLMASPGTDTLIGLRDTAIITLALCTGIRREELCHVEVEHLRQTKAGELALLIPKGKGNKQRMIPYGGLVWCLDVVETWLHKAGITSGHVFRGVLKDNKTVRDTPITKRAINKILKRYPVTRKGDKIIVDPHDLRRSYAKIMYDAGMAIKAIQENLGHEDMKTTLRYIGDSNISDRLPANVFNFDLGSLPSMEKQPVLL